MLVPGTAKNGKRQQTYIVVETGQSIPQSEGSVRKPPSILCNQVRPASDPARMAGTLLREAQRGTSNGNVGYNATPG